MRIRQSKPLKILPVYSVRHDKDSFRIFCKNAGNIMQKNHVIKDNSPIDALRLNLDLTKKYISETFKYSICNAIQNFHIVHL